MQGKGLIGCPPASAYCFGLRDGLSEAYDPRAQSDTPYRAERADKTLNLPVRDVDTIATVARLWIV
jgi:hypothetical protein